jgi:hypothetical protein
MIKKEHPDSTAEHKTHPHPDPLWEPSSLSEAAMAASLTPPIFATPDNWKTRQSGFSQGWK